MDAVPLFRYPRRCTGCREWIDVGSPDAVYIASGGRRNTSHPHCATAAGPGRAPAHLAISASTSAASSGSPTLLRAAEPYNPYSLDALEERYKGLTLNSGPAISAVPRSSRATRASHSPHSRIAQPTPWRPPSNRWGSASGTSAHGHQGSGYGHGGGVGEELGFGPAPPSFDECRERGIKLGELLAMPNLDVGHLFRTGLDVEKLCGYRLARPQIVHDLAGRGMTYHHILESIRSRSAQVGNGGGAGGNTSPFGFSLLGFGGSSPAPADPYASVEGLPFTRSEWRALGVKAPSEIQMNSAAWTALAE